MIICLGQPLPAGSSDPPESTTGSRIAFFSVLLRMEFTCARSVTTTAVVSYTAFPPLPPKEAVYFCCTGLGVTSTGRYPASCPVKPGLSSSVPFRLYSRDHLTCSHECYSNTNLPLSKVQIYFTRSHIKAASPYKLPKKRIPRDIIARYCNKIIQEFEKAFRLQILRFLLTDSEQKRLCIKLQAGQFID